MAKTVAKESTNPNQSNEQIVVPGLDAPEDPLLDISEVARLFDVSRQTVHNWINAKALQSIRTPGGLQKVRRSHVAAIIGVAKSAV